MKSTNETAESVEAGTERMRQAEQCTRELHVICQTHWDREWRLPFQQTRIMLVDMMDHLLALMQRDPGFRCFHLDGQSIPLEDYLEVRPEQRPALAAFISTGRLLVGPWYTLPEENLVAGECLVRNLLMGHRLSREFGAVMKVGFTPTSYGQIAQMPQLYRGFGIDTIFFHRGVPAHEVDLEYLWEGSDGSRLLGIRPPDGGRFNFTSLVTSRLFAAGTGDTSPYSEVAAADLQHAVSVKRAAGGSDVYYSTRLPRSWNRETMRKAVRQLTALAAARATTRYLYCGEGHDLMEPNPLLASIVADADALSADVKVVISSLPDYVALIRNAAPDLKLVRGEMRSTQKDGSGARLYAGTLSSRMPLKLANRKAEDALLRWAEPWCAVAWLLGQPYPETLLRQAWRYLLANHAHDTIAGTGIDQVQADALARFDQARLIAEELTRRSLTFIAARVDGRHADTGDALLTVFNPLPFTRDEVLRLDVDLPANGPQALRLLDSSGDEVPCHAEEPVRMVHSVQHTHGFPYRFPAVRHHLWMRATSLPALGCRTYVVKAATKHPPSAKPLPDEHAVTVAGPNQMENSALGVHVNDNGTIDILDKATGRAYRGLHLFEDAGETGDAYEHRRPEGDLVITSAREKARITLLRNTPYCASIRVELSLQIPESAGRNKHGRSSRLQTCEIDSTLTLLSDTRRLDIVTKVTNTARDHRLRVLFPTGLDAAESRAETQFDIQSRPVHLPPAQGWIEAPCPTSPQLGFVDLTDGRAGLAVISHGLPEYEVTPDDSRTIAITLLRCFTHETRATREDAPDQIGSQCLGTHEFRLAVYPHAGNCIEGKVLQETYRHNHRPRVVQSWKPAAQDDNVPPLPLAQSFLRLSPDDLVLSAVKKSESGEDLVVRLFNPTEREIRGELCMASRIVGARYLDLEENSLGDCPVGPHHTLSINAGPKKIVTIGMTLDRQSSDATATSP